MQPERFDKSLTQGRWKGILSTLGLTAKQLSGKHCECPVCQNGPKSDSFRFDDKEGRGTWICSHCGSGDGYTLVSKIRGVDFRGAMDIVAPLVGSVAFEAPKAKPESMDEARQQMTRVWGLAKPLDGHDMASRYMGSRGIKKSVWPLSLRFLHELSYSEDDGTFRMLPAMLAKFVAPDGKSAILHRTWLGYRDGRPDKANVKFPRKMWRGEIPKGGAVRLGPVAETMGVAEGIETALSAEIVAGVTVWATTSAQALVNFQPPPECKHLIIFADSDASYTGQLAGYSLARRLTSAPPDKRITVEVRLPMFHDVGDKADWNDVVLRELEGVAA